MQILHPFAGSIQLCAEEISDPDRSFSGRRRSILHAPVRQVCTVINFTGILAVKDTSSRFQRFRTGPARSSLCAGPVLGSCIYDQMSCTHSA
jgi:hypothetical protein